ncbi:MAG: hypothetical protein ACYC2U_01500 [Candidatus Amoebophilus sp.]
MAACNGYVKVVTLLMERGGRIYIQDK